MKPSTTFLALAAFFVSCVSSMAALNEAPPDPVIGLWRWTDKQIVDCKADNTFLVTPTNRKGTWKLVPDKSVERKYTFFWDGGLFVDHLTMSRGEKELKGKNQDGKEIRATKVQ